MDYLDPKKQARHRTIMLTGYVCLSVAVVIAALVLLYQAFGFGLGKNGQVVQHGLVFFSSQPNPANIYVNGKLNKVRTNSRVTLESGVYKITLARDGYQDWKRQIEVEGGDVQHFDYPRLFPKDLSSKVADTYTKAPSFISQSPDRRWVLIKLADASDSFRLYDLKNISKPPARLTLPDGVATAGPGSSWRVDEWADDNRHVLLRHSIGQKVEWVLMDRTSVDSSTNLNDTIKVPLAKLTLLDKKYNTYALFDNTGSLKKYKLGDASPTAWLDEVVSYKTYSTDSVLYVTQSVSKPGYVDVKLVIGSNSYPVKSLPGGASYLLDLTKYRRDLYVAVGSSHLNKVYIYHDPPGQLRSRPKNALVPTQVLHVEGANYLNFSQTAQYIVAEHGNQFGVYDIENKRGYNFSTTQPIDRGISHAAWMDGNRLTYVSRGKLLVFDFDYTNQRLLNPALAGFDSAYSPDYKYMLSVSPSQKKPGQVDMLNTSLLTQADQ